VRRNVERTARSESDGALALTHSALREISPKEFEQVVAYLRDAAPFNEPLCNGRSPTEAVKTLSQALARLAKFRGTAFRGLHDDKRSGLNFAQAKELVESWQRDNLVKDSGFGSASLNERIARRFGERILLRLRSESAAILYPLAPTPSLRREREVLFQPGTRFRVTRIREVRVGKLNPPIGWVVDAIEETS
jgi:NAD:arginine ADP-ribosyltransferase